MNDSTIEHDLLAQAEPYILARTPSVKVKRRVHVRGASTVGDVISPSPQATGGAMRKVGDVLNGPFAETYCPLIIVDDRTDPHKAESEIGILASLVRAQPFSALVKPLH